MEDTKIGTAYERFVSRIEPDNLLNDSTKTYVVVSKIERHFQIIERQKRKKWNERIFTIFFLKIENNIV